MSMTIPIIWLKAKLIDKVLRKPIWWEEWDNSDPTRWRWQKWPLNFSDHTCKVLDASSDDHDWGHNYGRLPGSGTEHLTRKDWDVRQLKYCLAEGAESRAVYRQYKGLRRAGWWAWWKNGRRMKKNGYETFDDVNTVKMRRRRKKLIL